MRKSVLGPGNWSKMAQEEAKFQRTQREKHDRRIAKAALENMGDEEFTFLTLCERFSESHPEAIRSILKRNNIEVASNGTTLRRIPPKLSIVR